MLLMIELFLLTFAVIALAPDTTLGEALRVWLIETPARALSRLTILKAVVGLIVIACLIGWAVSAPELVAMVGVGDMSLYLDAAVIAMLVSAITRLKFVLTQAIRVGQKVTEHVVGRSNRNGARDRRPRQRRRKPPRSSDDVDPLEDWAFA